MLVQSRLLFLCNFVFLKTFKQCGKYLFILTQLSPIERYCRCSVKRKTPLLSTLHENMNIWNEAVLSLIIAALTIMGTHIGQILLLKVNYRKKVKKIYALES